MLLTYLYLEHHTIEERYSLLFDSSMLLIKASSEGAGVHYNSIGKSNHMFAWFVIDFLSMSILFDTFINHRSLLAPMPFQEGSSFWGTCGYASAQQANSNQVLPQSKCLKGGQVFC